MINEFKNRLEAIRRGSVELYRNCSDINVIYKNTIKELTCYRNIIPEFFSYNSEAVKIKAIYKKLRELDYIRNRVIPCIDVQQSGYLYKEYFDGMSSFVKKYLDEITNRGCDNTAVMQKQLETAISADPLFIDSLFGGKNNPVVEQELTSAICHVEYLVDFLELLKIFEVTISDICKVATHECQDSDCAETAANIIKLIANSTCDFSDRMINTILDTYNGISDSLENKMIEKSQDMSFKVF